MQDPQQDSVFWGFGINNDNDMMGGVVRSLDNGYAWEGVFPARQLYGETTYRIMIPHVERLSNGDLIASIEYTEDDEGEHYWNEVAISEDNGGSWYRVNNGLPARFMPMTIAESASYPGRLFIQGYDRFRAGGLYRSDDFGQSFYPAPGWPSRLTHLTLVTRHRFTDDLLVCTMADGVWSGGDDGEEWTRLPMPPLGRSGVFTLLEDQIYFAGLYDMELERYRIDQDEWSLFPMPEQTPDTHIVRFMPQFAEGDTLITFERFEPDTGTAYIRTVLSVDDGETWNQQGPILSPSPSRSRYPRVYQGENVCRFVYFGSDSEGNLLSYVSLDTGHTWQTAPIPAESYGGQFNWLHTDSTLHAMIPYGGIFKSNNNGESWEDLNYPETDALAFGNASALDKNTGDLYVCGAQHQTIPFQNSYRLRDGSWEQRSTTEHYFTHLYAVPLDYQLLLIGFQQIERRFFTSSDSAQTWEEIHLDFPYEENVSSFNQMEYDEARQMFWLSTSIGMISFTIDELSVDESAYNPAIPGQKRIRSLS